MIEQILKGGPLMVPLMLCSLISLAVVYDRWMAFRENRKVDTRSLRSKVLAHLRQENIPAAISECETARGPIASVLLAGLRSYAHLRGKSENSETMRLVVGQVMEDYSAQAMSVVNKRLDVLTTIGVAAPLLGMTGTVTGMIASFAGLAEAGNVGGGGNRCQRDRRSPDHHRRRAAHRSGSRGSAEHVQSLERRDRVGDRGRHQ